MVVFAVTFIDHLGVDDPVGAFSVHGFGGIWGTLAVGLFNIDKGLFTGHGFSQLGLQLLGVVCYVLFTLVVSWIVWSALGAMAGGLRVDEQEELKGLDISEHGMEAYPDFGPTSTH
jgi:Amt family ammonium transporter